MKEPDGGLNPEAHFHREPTLISRYSPPDEVLNGDRIDKPLVDYWVSFSEYSSLQGPLSRMGALIRTLSNHLARLLTGANWRLFNSCF